MVDPTIQRENDGTFHITVGNSVHKGCQQEWSPALGRWTTVFKTPAPGPVIKTQYLHSDVEITEGKVLEMIHSSGKIPGVVRVGWYGSVKRDNGLDVECPSKDGRHRKVCLELMDEGDPFMGIETPYEALIVIWDLLEGGTFLHL